MDKKNILIGGLVLLIVIIGIIYFSMQPKNPPQNQQNQNRQNSNTFDIQGMKVEILQQGSGAAAKSGDKATVDYVGTLQNGTKFDASADHGGPFTFTLGENRVIQGWELGVTGMKVGEKRKLTIPPELAYGSQGAGNVIPPNSTLIFEVTLQGINK
jgi:FKBP-type peptidyl-prolyl cis-trans isomerase